MTTESMKITQILNQINQILQKMDSFSLDLLYRVYDLCNLRCAGIIL